jgi:hypothetical protein
MPNSIPNMAATQIIIRDSVECTDYYITKLPMKNDPE